MTLWTGLRTDRLHLRALRDADAGPITLYAGDRRVAEMTRVPHPYPPGAAEAYIATALKADSHFVWALDATPSGGAEFLGVVGYTPKSQTIGYWTGPPFWRQGYATEAARRLSDHLLAAGVGPVRATAMVENCGSQKVLERAGFLRTGQEMSYSIVRDAPVPVYAYVKGSS